jgi:16S rRNA C1402 (ribose-2'-O) methylase RsmI
MADDPSSAADTIGRLVRNTLRSGDTLSGGWVIHDVERLENGTRFAVTTSPAPVRLIVEVPRPGNIYAAQTADFGIWVDASGRDGHVHAPLCRELAARLTAPAARRGAESLGVTARAPGRTPTLFLAPGHLGDPEDISIRTLQVLASVSVIFVEREKANEVRALLARFADQFADGSGRAEIVEIDDPDETRALAHWKASVAAGLDTCLFGANEGIPAFCDPGKRIVIAAAQMGDAVTVRCVGGSSVLGHALMRVPVRFDSFEFGGKLYSEADAREVSAAPMTKRLPLVMFSQGNAVRAHLPEVLKRRGVSRGTVHLLVALTSNDEQCLAIDIATYTPPGVDALPDHRATVVIIDPSR